MRTRAIRPAILRNASTAEFPTAERCFITELSNSDADSGLSIARARVAPGVTTAWHRLAGITERYLIVSGSGVVEVGELARQRVVAGDVVIIPPDCRQRITNTGQTDLVFLALCTPRFDATAYVDLDAR